DAYVGTIRQPDGDWGLPAISARVEGRSWGVEAGDMFLPMLRPSMGFSGASAPLRGLGGTLRPGGGDGYVGVVAGAGRAFTCCDYFVPDQLMLAAATGGYTPERGPWVDALGGVMQRDQDPGPLPIASVRGGWRGDGADVEAAVAQLGAGTGASVNARITPNEQVMVLANGGFATRNLALPMALNETPMQGAGEVGALYTPSRKWTL